MLRAVLPWAIAAAAVAAITVVRRAIWHRRHARRFCPGPRVPWWRYALPWTAFRRSTCLYELTGLNARKGRGIVCPECGRETTRWWEIGSAPARWRLGEAAILALVVAAVTSRAAVFRSGRWASYLPTMPLVAMERALGANAPKSVRAQVRERLYKKSLSTEELNLLLPRLIADLGADSHTGNAQRAMWMLSDHYDAAEGLLIDALESTDWQRRQLAAVILGDHITRPAPDSLLRVCAEGLRSDDMPYESGRYTGVCNARHCAEFLVQQGERIAPYIAPGLESSDKQERWLCALVAGFAGCSTLAPKAAPILLERLTHHRTWRDARVAAPALYHLGPSAVPFLQPLVNTPDPRLRETVRLVLHCLTASPDEPPWAGSAALTTDITISSVSYWGLGK